MDRGRAFHGVTWSWSDGVAAIVRTRLPDELQSGCEVPGCRVPDAADPGVKVGRAAAGGASSPAGSALPRRDGPLANRLGPLDFRPSHQRAASASSSTGSPTILPKGLGTSLLLASLQSAAYPGSLPTSPSERPVPGGPDMAASSAAPWAAVPLLDGERAGAARRRGSERQCPVRAGPPPGARPRPPPRWNERRMEKGTKVASTSSVPPARTDTNLDPAEPVPEVPDDTAPAARLRVATMTNLERIRAARVSTRRRHQCDPTARPAWPGRGGGTAPPRRRRRRAPVARARARCGGGHQQAHQEQDEGGHPGVAAGAEQPRVMPASRAFTSEPDSLDFILRDGVGCREEEDHDLDGHHPEEQRQRELHEERPDQLAGALADDGLHRRNEEQRQHDDPGQSGHHPVVGPEPARADIDGGGADQHVADLRQQPFGTTGHPLAEAARWHRSRPMPPSPRYSPPRSRRSTVG